MPLIPKRHSGNAVKGVSRVVKSKVVSRVKTMSWINPLSGGALVKPPKDMGPVPVHRNKKAIKSPVLHVKSFRERFK